MFEHFRAFARLAALVLAYLALAPADVVGQGRSIAFESFRTEIRVQPDGTLDVAERLDVRFTGAWNGIFRDIPVEYLRYEDEGHGLARLKNRLDAYPRMADFLDRHLKKSR